MMVVGCGVRVALLALLCLWASAFTHIRSSSSRIDTFHRSHLTRPFIHRHSGIHTIHNKIRLNCALNTNENDEETIYKLLRDKLKGTCVYVIGMMGSGKSTVGKVLSQKLGYRFIDTDEVAEFMIEMPIADFFAEGKVEEFREVEYQVLMDLAQYTRVVVATGGGIVERNLNWSLLRHGIVVYIDMPPEQIIERLSEDPAQIAKRPLLRETDPLEKLKGLLEKRVGKYTQADVTVTIDRSIGPNDVSMAIAKGILDTLEKNPPVWNDWKKKRDDLALEAAMKANPVALAQSGALKGDGGAGKGSITYVNLSDIKSGKVKLPEGTQLPPELIEGLPKPQQEDPFAPPF